MRKVCTEEHLEEVPDVCYTYLSANKEALQFFVQQVFSTTDVASRRTLLSKHPELDGCAIYDDFQSIAMEPLLQVASREQSETTRSFFRVSEDALHMLLRALQFAKYCPLEPHHFDLRLSPIEEYGLKRRFRNFDSISPEESQAISWHVADVLYRDEKSKAFAKCRELGLDLDTKETVLREEKYPEWKNKCVAILLELLEYKAEIDIAVLLHEAPQKKNKYLNTLDNRLETEYSNLISDLRENLQRFFLNFQTDTKLRFTEINVEKELDPLRTGYEKERSNLRYMQPRSAIFEDASRLLGSGKETVMGDKYEIHGPAVGVGRNVNIQTVNFNQLWDQSRSSLDLGKLANDLARLREAMAKESTGAEEYAAVGNVASAEVAAKKENGPSTLEYLFKAGKWALDVAIKIGVPVAIEALKKTVGM